MCAAELPARSVAVAASLLLLNAVVISMAIAEDRQSVARKNQVSGAQGGIAAVFWRMASATQRVAKPTADQPGSGHKRDGVEGDSCPLGGSHLASPGDVGITEHIIGDDKSVIFQRICSDDPADCQAKEKGCVADVYNLEDSTWHIPFFRRLTSSTA